MADQERRFDDGKTLTKNVFTYAGGTFLSWNTEADGSGVSYGDGAPGNVADEVGEVVTLYAQWRPSFIVTFDATDGSFADGEKTHTKSTGANGVMEQLESAPENRPAYYEGRPPQQFDGWWTTATGGMLVQDGAVFDADCVLYAHWGSSGTKCVVSFDPQGGVVNPTSAETDYSGYLPGLLPIPSSHAGQVFEGWWSEPLGGVRVQEGTKYSSDTTLYAHWKNQRNTQVCLVAFDMNGHGSPKPALQVRGVQHMWLAEEPSPNPDEVGYTFGGWFEEADCVTQWYFGSDVLWEPLTKLYAKWTPHSYNVQFDANTPVGATTSGIMEDQARSYDDGVALPECAFLAQGDVDPNASFTFTGWNTQPDGSGDAFGEQDSQNVTDADGANVVLYAQWNKAQITTNRLPKGTQGEPYDEGLAQIGLVGSIEWSVVGGELPEGFVLDASTGEIAGTTEQAGSFVFTVQVTGTGPLGDAVTLTKELSIDVDQKEPEPLLFEFIAGMGSSWTKGSNSALPFETNGSFAMFVCAWVDDMTPLQDTDFLVFEGSTNIVLFPSYLETLSVGEHSLSALYNDGQMPTTHFTVEAAPEPEPTPDPDPEPEPEPEPKPQPQPEPEPKPNPSPNPDPKPEPTPDPNPKPKPDADPVPSHNSGPTPPSVSTADSAVSRQTANTSLANTSDRTLAVPLVPVVLLSASAFALFAVLRTRGKE